MLALTMLALLGVLAIGGHVVEGAAIWADEREQRAGRRRLRRSAARLRALR